MAKAKPKRQSNDKAQTDLRHILDCLNNARKLDPAAIEFLISIRVPCTQELADHPHIVASGSPVPNQSTIGTLGLINGLLGSVGIEPVAGMWDNGKLKKFVAVTPREIPVLKKK